MLKSILYIGLAWIFGGVQPMAADREYDFIIVGGGSAGCVVANRLSAYPDWRVLLLEAGPHELPEYDIPASPPFREEHINWNYYTERSNYSCLGREGQRCPIPRGKVLGGSSVINFMIYLRGSRLDYDEWAENGNYGWGYDDVLKYFLKSEDNGDKKIAENHIYHATGGPLHVERFDYKDKNLDKLIEAFNELGVGTVDLNAETSLGVMETQFTQKNNVRVSANSAFLKVIKNRNNLHIKTEALVTRILTDEYNTTFGVKYIDKYGYEMTVRARKDIIISAGTINSPKLLMLSGIGPAEELNKHNIKLVNDLRVGYNFQDHVTFGSLSIALAKDNAIDRTDDGIRKDMIEWEELKTGPMGSMGPVACNVFVKLNETNERNVPDVQYVFDGTYIEQGNKNISSLKRLTTKPLPYYNHINIKPILLRPKSKGYISLNEHDPQFGKPRIFTNFLTETEDLETLVDSAEFALKLLETESFKTMNATLSAVDSYPCNHLLDREKWRCAIKYYTATLFHPVGTCKMGPKTATDAVVDPELRVYGVDRLRVIDASIMPHITRGNTNAPTMMIAEKGADMVISYWRKFTSKVNYV